ncbi:MAG TPA: cytochrome C oxidase subunit IV family protein [Acidimicrobiales bacterium]|nr:cytochrome C oxidase subunit IV family protein [Acidimicrobiales bacterium]
MTVTHEGTADAGYEAATDEARHEHHPKDAQYWKVGLALGLITLLEVGTYFIADPPYDHDLAPLLIGSLIFMMVLKFVVIGAYFMHLKFDNRLFRNVFVAGLLLAVGVYLAVLTAFEFWTDRYEDGTYDEDTFLVEDAPAG